MKASPGSPPRSDAPSLLRSWAELAGLWALALAWPIYQRIGSGPEALTGLGIRRGELLLFVAILSFLIPFLLAVPARMARLRSDRAALWIHSALIGMLAGVVVWAALQPGVLSYLLGAATVIGAFLLRSRTDFGRRFTAILAVATPVTVVLFFASYPVSDALLPGESGAEAGRSDAENPVVIVVLDELPLPVLIDSDDRIDRRLFPNFARLSDESTWYRQAISLSDHTLSALPAILTGEDPRAETTFGEPTPPGYPAYPDTVCSVAERAGYASWGIQFATDLCGRSEDLPNRLTRLLLSGLPADIPEAFQEILGEEIQPEGLTPGRVFERTVESLVEPFGTRPEPWGDERDEEFREFTADLPAGRAISLLHSALPHSEYQYLPDGRVYPSRSIFDGATIANLSSPVNAVESGKNLQQLTAQTMYVDRLLGELIDRLKQRGSWEDTLFALVADHGASFAPGTERRHLSAANSGWLLPVPLFIKLPGQTEGKVTDAAADIRDVTPTVLDVIGLSPSPRATGRSLRHPKKADRTVVAIDAAGSEIEIPRRTLELRRRQAIEFRNRFLGNGLFALGGSPDLLGKPASTLEARPIPFEPEDELGFDPKSFDRGVEPLYFQATLSGVTRDPGPLAVVVDGRIVATAQAWERDGKWLIATNLPLPADPDRIPRVTLFPVQSGPGADVQRP